MVARQSKEARCAEDVYEQLEKETIADDAMDTFRETRSGLQELSMLIAECGDYRARDIISEVSHAAKNMDESEHPGEYLLFAVSIAGSGLFMETRRLAFPIFNLIRGLPDPRAFMEEHRYVLLGVVQAMLECAETKPLIDWLREDGLLE